MYTKNFVRNRIQDGELVDVTPAARNLGFRYGVALTHAVAALGADAVVATVVRALLDCQGGVGLFQMVPFDNGRFQRMLVLEMFGHDEGGSGGALWTVVDLA